MIAGRGRPRKAAPGRQRPVFPAFCSCGELYRLLSSSGHPCARQAGHPVDELGHVCCCEAEHRLETQNPRTAGGAA